MQATSKEAAIEPAKRRSRIGESVVANGHGDYTTLAERFGVSEMTVRRDIEALEEQGVVRKVLGGAIPAIGTADEPEFSSRAARAAESKGHLAEAAVALLKPRETVILDSGSTVLAVAREIKGKELGLTVITPSLTSAFELVSEPDTTVLVAGGRVRPGELTTVGAEAEEALGRYYCDTYIMGIAGVHHEFGLSEYNREESEVKRAAMAAARRVVLVVDQTKFGLVHLVRIGPLSTLSHIVTDAPDDHPGVVAARNLGVEVVRPSG